jgi:thimet oligopeptidase
MFFLFISLFALLTLEPVSTHPFLLSLIKKDEDVFLIEKKILTLYSELIFEKLEKISIDEINTENAYTFFQKTFLEIDRVSEKISNLSHLLHYFLLTANDNMIKKEIFSTLERIQIFTLAKYLNSKKIFDLLSKISLLLQENKEIKEYERLFMVDTLAVFAEKGINLSQEKKLLFDKKTLALSEKERSFQHNIQTNNSYILMSAEELEGIEDISFFEKKEEKYILRPNYPTYNLIMRKAKNRYTREKYYYLFRDQAFPENKLILEEIRVLRSDLAELLDKASYSRFDLESQMVKSFEQVESFLFELQNKTNQKAKKERESLTKYAKKLLQEESLVIFPWDISYIIHHYEKDFFEIDEEKMSEFFELEQTFKKLFTIIKSFFGISVKEIIYENNDWKIDNSIKILELKKNNIVLGHLLLDLFPREGKFKHFAFSELVSDSSLQEEKLGMIIGNFTPAEGKTVVLLKFQELISLFHEFGHALHFFLSETKLFGQSGTHVVADFVEVPSRVFEQWPKNKEILKFLSEHILDHTLLSDEIIEKILQSDMATRAISAQRQIMLSNIALYMFDDVAVPLDALYAKYSKDVSLSNFQDKDESKKLCSFGHLVNDLYGPKYYSYLWAEILALNILEKINKEGGLLNEKAGEKYIQKILSLGGSVDPKALLKDYFEHDAYYSSDAFYFYINEKNKIVIE